MIWYHIKSEGMEAKYVEKYLCPVLAGKSWRSIKLWGNCNAIQLLVSYHCFPNPDSLCFMLSRDHWNFISNFWDIYLFLVYDIVIQPCFLVFGFHYVDITVISHE